MLAYTGGGKGVKPLVAMEGALPPPNKIYEMPLEHLEKLGEKGGKGEKGIWQKFDLFPNFITYTYTNSYISLRGFYSFLFSLF